LGVLVLYKNITYFCNPVFYLLNQKVMAFNTVFAFLGDIGTGEIMLIMLVVLLLFGAKKIPELARGMGRGIREFKDATKEIKNEMESAIKEDPKANS